MTLFLLLFPLSGFAQKDGRLARNKCVQVTTARWQRRGERTGALLSLASCARRHGRSRSQGGPRPTRARQGKHRAARRRDGTGGSRWRVMRWRFPQRGVPAPWRHQRMGAGLFASARISCALQLGRLYCRCRLRRAGGDGAPAGIDRSLRRRTAVTRRDPCARRWEPGDYRSRTHPR